MKKEIGGLCMPISFFIPSPADVQTEIQLYSHSPDGGKIRQLIFSLIASILFVGDVRILQWIKKKGVAMKKGLDSEKSLVISYLTLRTVIGILGIALPVVVSLGALIIFRTGLQGSISGYYYTGMRNVLVGTLWATGFFLLSYKGYAPIDDILSNFACLAAIGIALFPTAPESGATSQQVAIGWFHLGFAGIFFSILIVFCLHLFTKTSSAHPTRQKLQRNIVYRVCGYSMIACIALLVVYSILQTLLPKQSMAPVTAMHPIYWLEALSLVAFGISWLTKGETILKDKPG